MFICKRFGWDGSLPDQTSWSGLPSNFSYTPNTCGKKIGPKAVKRKSVPNAVEKKAWGSEAWRRKAWVEVERISASESRNYEIKASCHCVMRKDK
ncbi:hypothetical protein AVEN_78953-1 [Araneus ventricosus]|uniref:Uncharacterized protein n=1 Tax=Araneus ventricosus TaxID=182803 RepID=A0A4Y2K601_ARAVE|nr:hypothetical protein AVEN_78953-1 [Araneus ventricosus]